MATPTPSTHTPQKHLPPFSSPAPRSVPGMVNFDSPAALGLLAEGGVGMGISMSGMGMSSLGLTASAMGRADEDERRRRLESIIATLRAKPGRVTQDGIIDLCKKEGLEVMIDPPKKDIVALSLLIGNEAMCEILVKNGEVLTDSVKLEVNNDRHDYAASGSRILADSLRPVPGISKINLTLERFAHNLDKLLRMDKLSAPENGGVSCYQAIFGVYSSLRKLFEHEKKLALAILDDDTPFAGMKAEREVICKRSGRPRINAGSCLGLSLEYWMDRRHIGQIPRRRKPELLKGKDKAIGQSTTSEDYPEDTDADTNKTYSLTIECESSPSSMYPPIRISDSWVSDAIDKAHDATDSDLNNILLNRPTIDWIEPPPTYLSSAAPEADHDAMNLDNAPGRLPNIRFIAKFNPPLVVPLSVFVNLQQSFGLEVPGDIRATTFVGLALRPGETDPGVAGTSNDTTQEISVDNPVLVRNRDGKEEQKLHSTSLYVPRTEYSRTIESVPFSHPRQLIEILPTLRQYAFTSSLLQHSFGNSSSSGSEKKKATTPLSPPLTPASPKKDELPKTQLDVSLSYAPPAPHLRLDIPHPSTASIPILPSDSTDLLALLLADSSTSIKSKPPLTVSIEVHPNAELVVTEQNLVSTSKVKKKDGDIDMDASNEAVHAAEGESNEKVKRIAKALDICGDLGVWGEWIRREAEKEL